MILLEVIEVNTQMVRLYLMAIGSFVNHCVKRECVCYAIQNSRTCSGPQVEAFNIKSKQTRQKIFGPCCPSRTAFSVEGMFAAITSFKRRKVKDYKEACFVLGDFIVQVKTCRDFTVECRDTAVG